MNRRRQAGVALLTVLLLVAVMSVLLVLVLDDIRFGQRRAFNAASQSQAQWYALGAESLAGTRLASLWQRDRQRTTLDGGWNGRSQVFPLDHGLIEATLTDRTHCFNLNAVVEGAGEMLQRREAGLRQFRALLEALDVPPPRAETLADTLADWIDSDDQPGPRGAEDASYLATREPYRSGATLLAEASELRAVQGFDAALYARLRPHVCALPIAAPTPVNLNTLEADDALQVVAMAEGRIDLPTARQAIRRRPPGGWRDVAAFWTLPELAQAIPDDTALAQASLRSRYFTLQARVRHLDAEVVLASLLEIDDTGRVRTLA
ncbi:MAG TPA: type II secretion system minor pseudopilin GspK, partial [Arenimonas sp.]|nr:type II secretion system minor pseudopilin GspK [Arenimonas sp.]